MSRVWTISVAVECGTCGVTDDKTSVAATSCEIARVLAFALPYRKDLCFPSDDMRERKPRCYIAGPIAGVTDAWRGVVCAVLAAAGLRGAE